MRRRNHARKTQLLRITLALILISLGVIFNLNTSSARSGYGKGLSGGASNKPQTNKKKSANGKKKSTDGSAKTKNEAQTNQDQNGNGNNKSNTGANGNDKKAGENADENKAENANGKKSGPAGDGGQAATVCRNVSFSPPTPDDDSLAKRLDKAGGVDVKYLGSRTLMLCGPPDKVDVVSNAVGDISNQTAKPTGHETHVVRLFFFRKAADVAGAINNSGGLSTTVKALGDDLLVFTSESAADEQAIKELKRWIAMIDVPRPEISLLAWSVQISSKDPGAINDRSTEVRASVALFNDRLQSALDQGWRYLEWGRRTLTINGNHFFAPELYDYLTNRYIWMPPGSAIPRPSPSPAGPTACAEDKYCLGYDKMFDPIQPSLTGMLLALVLAQPLPTAQDSAARKDPKDSLVLRDMTLGTEAASLGNSKILRMRFVKCLESAEECQQFRAESNMNLPSPKQKSKVAGSQERAKQSERNKATAIFNQSCETDDYENLLLYDPDSPPPGPYFRCFAQQLDESLTGEHLAQLRKALADFLFQYKSAQRYPQQFIPYNHAASSQALDANLDPLIVAFNRDLGVYLRHIQDNFQNRLGAKSNKKVEFASDGIVTARVLSGSTANVNTTTQSFFPSPPTLSAREFVNKLAESSTGLAPIMTGHAADVITAAIQAEQRTTAQVGRNLNLQVTANTLQGASASEMDVALDSSDSDTPKLLDTAGTSSSDNLSRVAKHTITTKVRVDSQKLFEISSFSAALQHGRSVPLIPPFVDLPYIGNLARLHLRPGTVYHRSFAIVSAVIVPTAADLANTIEFRDDLEPVPKGKAKLIEEPKVVNPEDKTTNPVRPGRRRSARPKQTQATDTKQKPDEPKNKKTDRTVYYWVVTNFREGASLAGPFKVTDAPAPFTGTRTVTLLWGAPEGALSFVVLRTDSATRPQSGDRCDRCALLPNSFRAATVEDPEEVELHETTIVDNGRDLQAYTIPVALSRTYARIPRQAGNLVAFHKLMLECIRDEALGSSAKCPVLSRTAVEGYAR